MSEERKPRPSLKDIANAVAARDSGAPPSMRISGIPAGTPSGAPLSGRASNPPDARPSMGSRPSNPPEARGSIPSRPSNPGERISAPPVSRPPTSTPGQRTSAPPGSLKAIAQAAPPAATGSGHVDLDAAARISAVPSAPPSGRNSNAPVSKNTSATKVEAAEANAASSKKEDEASPIAKLAKAAPAAAPAPEKKGGNGVIIGAMVLLGAGAIAFAMTRGSSTTAATPPATPAASTPAKLAVSAPADRNTPAPAVKKDDGAVDISSLGATSADAPAATVPGPLRPRNPNDKDGDGKPDAKPADSAPPPPDTAAPSAAAAPTPAPTGSVGALADEMRKRVGATDDPNAPADNAAAAGNPDAKQQRPSAGAVSGAIGAVRGAARACLDGQESITRVSVVFSSDGSVKSVSVSGGAAGTGAESCVRSAVQKAKVAPFVESSYSTSFTIRP